MLEGYRRHFEEVSGAFLMSGSMYCGRLHSSSVADPLHFDLNPDPRILWNKWIWIPLLPNEVFLKDIPNNQNNFFVIYELVIHVYYTKK